MTQTRPRQTIAVTARSRPRSARLRLRHPQSQQPSPAARLRPAYPGHAVHREYDANLAMELIASTCELPGNTRGLLIVLAEYRRALHDLAIQAATSRTAHTPQDFLSPGPLPSDHQPREPQHPCVPVSD